MNNLPEGVASFGKRLSRYSIQEDEIRLEFRDGSEASCDLLVGCDGIKSVVRKQLLEELSDKRDRQLRGFIDPVFTGTMAYRALMPVELLPKHKDDAPHPSSLRPMMVRQTRLQLHPRGEFL